MFEQSLMMNEVHPVHGNLYIIDSVLLATSKERERGRRRTQWTAMQYIKNTSNIELHRGLFAQSISQLSQGLLQQGQAGPECGLGGIIETRFNCTQLTITYKSLSHTASKYSLQAAGLTVAHSSMMLGIKKWWSLCQDYCLYFCLRLQQQKGGYNAQWSSHLLFFNLHSFLKWLCFIHYLITISGCYSVLHTQNLG